MMATEFKLLFPAAAYVTVERLLVIRQVLHKRSNPKENPFFISIRTLPLFVHGVTLLMHANRIGPPMRFPFTKKDDPNSTGEDFSLDETADRDIFLAITEIYSRLQPKKSRHQCPPSLVKDIKADTVEDAQALLMELYDQKVLSSQAFKLDLGEFLRSTHFIARWKKGKTKEDFKKAKYITRQCAPTIERALRLKIMSEIDRLKVIIDVLDKLDLTAEV
jgi:hypothetical protein